MALLLSESYLLYCFVHFPFLNYLISSESISSILQSDRKILTLGDKKLDEKWKAKIVRFVQEWLR